MRVVLDADVVIGALDGSDPHHRQARALFTAWQQEEDTRLISVVNLSEVLVAPAGHPQRLRAAREAIAALGVAVHRPSEAVGVAAARLRREHQISLPDGFCLATAHQTGGSVATFDEKLLRAARAERIALARMSRPRRR